MHRAFTAAQGRLYLLAGESLYHGLRLVPFDIYEPHLGTWFKGPSPAHEEHSGTDWDSHAMTANQQERMLVVLGGSDLTRYLPCQWGKGSHVWMYDVSSGNWQEMHTRAEYQGGSTWPHRCGRFQDVCAAPADAFTIMAMVSSAGDTEAMVDLLDLRMWKWR